MLPAGDYVWAEIASQGLHEMAGCPPEYYNIPVGRNDTSYRWSKASEPLSIPYKRSAFDDRRTGRSSNRPREQLATVTATLDGSNIYGEGRLWVDQLRLRSTTCPGRAAASNVFSSKVRGLK